jgi:hypothetical protein
VFGLVVLLAIGGCTPMTNSQGMTRNSQTVWNHEPTQEFASIRAVGFAPIDAQYGKSDDIRQIKAMRASKLDAYRELTERVYGQKISSDVSVNDLVLGNELLEASVFGVIRGAKVIKSYRHENTYITEMELDFSEIYRITMSLSPNWQVEDQEKSSPFGK